jgi:hypothetical protein
MCRALVHELNVPTKLKHRVLSAGGIRIQSRERGGLAATS